MKRSKRWTCVVFWSILISVGTVVGINLVVDADGILRTDFSRQFQPPNMSFAKIRYLLHEKKRYDSFLFGSSRVGNIDVNKIPGGRYYNMFYAAGLPEEHLEHLRFLLKNGIIVRNVLIGLDDFSFLFDPRDHLPELDLQPHPGISGKSRITFYGEYFFKLNRFVPQVAAYLRHNYTRRDSPEENRYRYDIFGSGTVLCRDCDERIERHRKEHIESKLFLEPADYRFVERDELAPSLSALSRIAELSRENGFHLIVFINPLHRTVYLHADLARFARFKRELAGITDYYDFSGLNSVTTDNYYYYETSHYRRLVGDMMLKVMFGRPDVAVPADFGFHVTSSNIRKHLIDQCREIRASGIERDGRNRAFADSCLDTGA